LKKGAVAVDDAPALCTGASQEVGTRRDRRSNLLIAHNAELFIPPSDGSTACQEVNDENDQSHHQKQVNQAAADAADETHEPENQQNH
jgi:hypothetical protein